MDFTGEKMPSIADAIKSDSMNSGINSMTDFSSNSSTQGFSIPWYLWLLLILVICFIVGYFFVYLNNEYKDIPYVQQINNFFGNTAKDISNKALDFTNTTLNSLNSLNSTTKQGQAVSTTTPEKDAAQTTPLYNSLNKAHEQHEQHEQQEKQEKHPPNSQDYSADDSASSIQQTKSASKAGWCFIGEDRGFRSCIKVNDEDNCMSGSIFPSQEICVNPNLRV
jgi:hypothetical protein